MTPLCIAGGEFSGGRETLYMSALFHLYLYTFTTQVCPQFPVAGGVVSYAREDCHYMNFYIPTDASRLNSTELPVFFWIYGGG